jgi:GTP-binding protein
LQIFIHLIDARHPNLEIDINVDEFLNTIKRPDQIIIHAYTKIDKLKKNDLNKLKQQDPEGIFISNLKKTGMDKLEQTISEYLFGN